MTPQSGGGIAAINVSNTAGATGALSVTTGSGEVVGSGTGIQATNAGHGTMTIAVGGDVTGVQSYGIDLSNSMFATGGVHVSSVSGSEISGGLVGIRVQSTGGALTMDLDGGVTALGGAGILAVAGPGSTGLDLAVTDVSGTWGGVIARSEGTGAARIAASGTIQGGAAAGIDLTVLSTGGAAEVTATGPVTGGSHGIRLTQGGSGTTRVETGTGGITATDLVNGIGIQVDVAATNSAGVTVVTGSGAVSGGEGAVVSTPGSGAMSVTLGGNVTGHAGDAVRLVGGSGGAAIGLQPGVTLTGAGDGLDLSVTDGGVTLTGTGNMTGTAGVGLRVTQTGGTGDLTLFTGAVSGGAQGILLDNQGGGGISLVASGQVTGASGAAVEASVLGNGGLDVTLLAGGLSTAGAGALLTDYGPGRLRLATGAGSELRGGTHGASLVNLGGRMELSAAGAIIGETGSGLIAESRSGAGEMQLEVAAVSGAVNGVSLTQDGVGEMRLTATGAISGGTAESVLARVGSGGSGEMVLALASVSGATDGIRAIHDGALGGIDITATGAVTGQSGTGIVALNSVMAPGGGGGISVTTSGPVDGGLRGIHAVNDGTGDLLIGASGQVTGAGGEGILALNGATGGRLEVSTAGVAGLGDGIRAGNLGSGDTRLTLTAGHLVEGTGGQGVDLTHQGTGNVTVAVQTGATLRGTGGHGLSLVSTGGSADSLRTVTIGLDALIEGSDRGISAAVAAGRLSIIGTGLVRGLSGDAIRADLSGGAGDASFSLRQVEGAANGIVVLNQGLGAIELLSDGHLSGAGGHAVWIEQGTASQGDVTVDVTAVTGRDGGLYVDHQGQAGKVSITTRGLVQATGGSGIGLVAVNGVAGAAGGGITVETQAVSGGAAGLVVENAGAGAVDVTTLGLVEGGSGDAIRAVTGAAGTELSVTSAGLQAAGAGLVARNLGTGGSAVSLTGAVVAGTLGVDAEHHGAGSLNVTLGGDVSASGADGVGLRAVATRGVSGGLSVTTASGTLVRGEQHGAVIAAAGGTVRVTGDGDFQGGTGTGLAIDLGTGVHGAILTLAEVSGGTNGLELVTSAQGAVDLSISGPVTGGSGAGLLVEGTADQQAEITIQTAGVVSGGLVGVQARQAGGGGLSITAQDLVQAGGDGVVVSSAGAGAITLDLGGGVTAGASGLRANAGTGNLDVTLSGAVAGQDGYGVQLAGGGVIDLVQGSGAAISGTLAGLHVMGSGGPITLSLEADVTASAGTGLSLVQSGAGSVQVTATGQITGQGGHGVVVETDAPAGLPAAGMPSDGVLLDLAGVTASQIGVGVTHRGAGAVGLTASGPIQGGSGAGVLIETGAASGSVTLALEGPVSGGSAGLAVIAGGAGTTSVNTAALVSASAGDGVVIQSGAQTTGLTVTHAGVTATGSGMLLTHQGSGSVSVTTSGAVRAGDGVGVQLIAGADTNTVDLSLGEVSGASGVVLAALGGGDTTLALSGPVLASDGSGVVVETGSDGGTLNMELARVRATDSAVVALHGGAGDVSLTLAGDLLADGGAALDLARSQAGRIDLSVAAGRVLSGGTLGLRIANVAGGETVLDLSGTISGDIALAVLGEAGSLSHVTLRDGALLRGSVALLSDEGDSVTEVAAGAVIDGAVALGEGDDRLTISGADLSAVTLLDGGADAFGLDGWDVLELEDVTQGFLAEALTGWEEIDLSGETVLGLGAGDWQAGQVTVGTDAALVLLGGQVDLAGGLVLSGQLGLLNEGTGDHLTIGGDLIGGGVIFVDVDFASGTADRLSVTGDVLPGDTPTIIAVEDLTVGAANGAAVVLVDVGGQTADGDFVLAGGPIYKGAFGYDLHLTPGGQWVLAEGFSIMASSFEATPSLLRGFAILPTLAMRQNARLRRSADGRFAGWLRVSGDIQDTSLITQSGADVTSRDASGLEAGIELHSDGSTGAGHWVLGASVHTGIVRGVVENETARAVIDADGWGLGASLAWLGDSGSWVDVQGRVSWQKTDLTSTATGPLLTAHDSTVWALGVEAGHRIPLAAGGALVPQVQLNFARVEAGEAEDSLGNAVVLGRNDSLEGRVALAYEFGQTLAPALSATLPEGQRHPFHLLLGLRHEFSDVDQVLVAGSELTAATPRTWGEVALGGRWTFGRGQEIYAEGSYRRPLRGGTAGDRGLAVSMGLRLAW